MFGGKQGEGVDKSEASTAVPEGFGSDSSLIDALSGSHGSTISSAQASGVKSRSRSSSGDSLDLDSSAPLNSSPDSTRRFSRSERRKTHLSSHGGVASSHLSSHLDMAAPPMEAMTEAASVSSGDISAAHSIHSRGELLLPPERPVVLFSEELFKAEREAAPVRFGNIFGGADYPMHMKSSLILYRRAENLNIKIPKMTVDSIDGAFTAEVRFMVPSRLADAIESDLRGRISELNLPVVPEVFQRKYDGAKSGKDHLRYGCFTYIPEEGKPVVMNYIDLKMHVNHVRVVGQLLNNYFNDIITKAPRPEIFRAEDLATKIHRDSGSEKGPWTAAQIKHSWVSSYKYYLDMSDEVRSRKSKIRAEFYSFRTSRDEHEANVKAGILSESGNAERYLRHMKPSVLRSLGRYLACETHNVIKAEDAKITARAKEERLEQIKAAEAEREAIALIEREKELIKKRRQERRRLAEKYARTPVSKRDRVGKRSATASAAAPSVPVEYAAESEGSSHLTGEILLPSRSKRISSPNKRSAKKARKAGDDMGDVRVVPISGFGNVGVAHPPARRGAELGSPIAGVPTYPRMPLSPFRGGAVRKVAETPLKSKALDLRQRSGKENAGDSPAI